MLKIYQDRAVNLSFPSSLVAHPQNPYGFGFRKACAAEAPQQRIGTYCESEFSGEACLRPSSEGEADEREGLLQAIGLAGAGRHLWKLLGEDGLSHCSSSRKKRRTRTCKGTGAPCQGRSATVRLYRLSTRLE